jgi:CRISPR-associated protein Cmr3
MMNWYSFTPQDTLFFRGAEPANMGENHTATMIFPPAAHTIAGAIRTAVLTQNGIDFKKYSAGTLPPEQDSILAAIGKSGEESPFDVIGPLFFKDGKLWAPCPYVWFAEKKDKQNIDLRKRAITVSARLGKNTLLKTSASENLFWAKGNNLEALGGGWVCLDELCKPSEEKTILENSDFFVSENRTGIALDVKDQRRKAREGHLYSFVHARLQEGVSLAFGVTKKLPVADIGVLKLGAEQRFGEYRLLKSINLPQGKSSLFMTLSILSGNDELNQCCVATGRILYYGGWDLHRGFHKPMKGYFPAGSVFTEQINENFIKL